MHEWALAEGVITTALKAGETEGMKRILRIEVRDEAGNLTAHELDRPIPNDGLVPQGRIRGLSAAGG